MPDNTDIRDVRVADKGEPGLTKDFNKIAYEVTGESPPLRERASIAWEAVKPHWYRTAWWIMMLLTILVISMDVNAQLGGAIGSMISWVRESVFQQYPGIPFVLGVLACYYILVKGRFLRKK